MACSGPCHAEAALGGRPSAAAADPWQVGALARQSGISAGMLVSPLPIAPRWRIVPFGLAAFLLLLGLGRPAGAAPLSLNDDCLFASPVDCDVSCGQATQACLDRQSMRCTPADECTAECVTQGGVLLCDDEVETYGDLEAAIAYAEMVGLTIQVPPSSTQGGGAKGCSALPGAPVTNGGSGAGAAAPWLGLVLFVGAACVLQRPRRRRTTRGGSRPA